MPRYMGLAAYYLSARYKKDLKNVSVRETLTLTNVFCALHIVPKKNNNYRSDTSYHTAVCIRSDSVLGPEEGNKPLYLRVNL